MKIFLSGSSKDIVSAIAECNIDYYLYSFYYFQKEVFAQALSATRKEMLIDSGAHTFQSGVSVDFDKFMIEYLDFIKKYDCPKIVGYFELDVDHALPYSKILEYRGKMMSVTDKVIPVWHKERGIEDFIKTSKEFDYVGIAGFRNQDISDKQFSLFNNVAKQNKCKLHALGLTRLKIMRDVDFYSVDSTSWLRAVKYGEVQMYKNGKLSIVKGKAKRGATQELLIHQLKQWKRLAYDFEK